MKVKKEKPIELNRLRPRDGDVFVIKEDAIDEEYREDILKRLDSVLKANHVLIVFVPKLSDVKLLSEEQMNNYGWYRKPE